jgi:cell division septation protein DedD
VNAEFNWWLLIVGLVVGAGLVWLVVMDSRRREAEIDAVERPREAAWLSAVMAEDGYDVSPAAADRILLLHRAYLDAPPPDGVGDEADEFDDDPGRASDDQSWPTSTGAVSMDEPDASTSETPKVAAPATPETAGAGPLQ